MTNWTDLHVRTMLALRGRVDIWFRNYVMGPHKHEPTARIKFFEAFHCWYEAKRAEAQAKGEEAPSYEAELSAVLGRHAPEFAEPLETGDDNGG